MGTVAVAPQPASAAAVSVRTASEVRRDVRMRVYVKIRSKLKRGRSATVTLSARRSGSSSYAAKVTFSGGTAKLQRLSYDSAGRVTKLGGPVTLVPSVKLRTRVYLEFEAVDVSQGTRLRVRGWRHGQAATTREWIDLRSTRPTQAGTTAVTVSRTKGVRKPTVHRLPVAQPTATAVSPAPRTPSNLPPNPNSGHSGWTGRVAQVLDGDTVAVYLDSDPTRAVQVRNAGIQAMEVNQCNGPNASRALAALAPPGSRILLTARYASSTSTVGGVTRLLRFIYVLKDGKWVDTQLALLERGEVLWYPIPSEYANSTTYRAAMERAQMNGVGMFDPVRACGTPGSDTAQIWINFDGDGDENVNVNSEYVRVKNPTSGQLDLSGWWIRDGSQVEKRFPSGTVLPPHSTLTVHVGKGTDSVSARRFYWGWASPRYQNTIDPASGRRAAGIHGNAGYLFDPRGNLRSMTTYPCATCGSHVLKDQVRLAVQPTGDDEHATVTNMSPQVVDVSHLLLQARGSVYEIASGTALSPGEMLTVHMRTGTASRLNQYWGKVGQYNLPDGGYEMRLRDARDVPVACVAWGTGAC
jgi:micrococcal nuclease